MTSSRTANKNMEEKKILHFGGKTTRTFDEFFFIDFLTMHIPLATFLGEFDSEASNGTSKEGILYDGSSINCWHRIS
jgi:hypothetical protein